jgi:hypothetical protein
VTGSPQHIDLLPQDQNFCLKHTARPQQVDHHSKDQSAQIQHRAAASPGSRSPASRIRFTVGIGSGTTLIAAERTGRRGHGIEIDPLYCDIIVRRLRTACRLEATLESAGKSFQEIQAERSETS